MGLAPGDVQRGQPGVGGQVKAGGKVVGAAVGQVAQQRALRQRHQAGDRFVQSAVAAGADHRIVVGAPLRRHAAGVAAGLRDKDPHQIAGAGKSGYRIEQGGAGLGLTRPGVDNEQELFHGSPPLVYR